MRKSTAVFLVLGSALCSGMVFGSTVHSVDARGHFAANSNFDASGHYLPGAAGFNLADVSSLAVLNALPAGVNGLVWVGKCSGVDAGFIAAVQPYIGNPKLFGFYLMDGPDPGTAQHPGCTAEMLKAEADWIHTHAPGVKTFIVLRNMTAAKSPSFDASFKPANSHIDLFGLAAYPCRTEVNGCDYDMINRYVAAAELAGIPRANIVPVYQAFGGGTWKNDADGQYTLPTASQARQILLTWHKLVPEPVFDYTFSWGSQNADVSLDASPELRDVFSAHNAAAKRIGVK